MGGLHLQVGDGLILLLDSGGKFFPAVFQVCFDFAGIIEDLGKLVLCDGLRLFTKLKAFIELLMVFAVILTVSLLLFDQFLDLVLKDLCLGVADALLRGIFYTIWRHSVSPLCTDVYSCETHRCVALL